MPVKESPGDPAVYPAAAFEALVREVRACRICASFLPLGPRPVLHGTVRSRLLIISQAPGTRVHETGISFNDRSGDRLRQWLGIDRAAFYDEARIAILPMGMCYPGVDGHGGDLPPRPECAPAWHPRILWSSCRRSASPCWSDPMPIGAISVWPARGA